MEIHPAAAIFPMMSDEELRNLAADIQENGLVEPVVVYHGQVLDGRNRLRACEIAGVSPRFEDANGNIGSPVVYVLSKNLHRRHLTQSQRAVIAAEIVPMLAEEAKKRREATRFGTNSNGMRSVPIGAVGEISGPSREIAAKALGVGSGSVNRALIAKRDNPEGFEKARRGELTITAAANGYTAPPGADRAPKDVSTVRGAQRAEANKRRMVEGLAVVGGVCHGLENLDVPMTAAACDAEEIETWATKAEQHASELRKFAKKLRGAING